MEGKPSVRFFTTARVAKNNPTKSRKKELF
nr:MAG TPA: hypothetical protein [Bacteriophage sp.]